MLVQSKYFTDAIRSTNSSYLLLILCGIILGFTTDNVQSAAVSGNLLHPRRAIEQTVNSTTSSSTSKSPTTSSSSTSSPQSCLVNGLKYQHGQQIDRYQEESNVNSEDDNDESEEDAYDPCVYCLCVDGDMYCWWGDENHHSQCNVATSSTVSTTNHLLSSGSINMSNSNSTQEASTMTAPDTSSSFNSASNSLGSSVSASSSLSDLANTGGSSLQYTVSTITDDNVPSPSAPTVCIVMGREYYQGEVLPHETGTCLECQCGKEGRVTCSPKDCITQQDDEFHNPSDTNSLDMFDVDIF